MLWFEGSIAEAIQKARKDCKLFVVYVEGNDEGTKKMEDVWLDPEVVQEFDGIGTVVLKIKAETQEYRHFVQVYPVAVVPSSYFIGENGLPLEIALGDVKASELIARLKRAAEAHNQELRKLTRKQEDSGDAPPSLPDSGIGSVPPLASAFPSPSVSVGSNAAAATTASVSDSIAKVDLSDEEKVGEDCKEEIPAVASTESLSKEERVERAKTQLERIRRKKAEDQIQAEKDRELSRRQDGRNVQSFKSQRAQKQAEELARQRKKEREEERKAKEAILAQIERDKAERAQRLLRQKTAGEAQKAEKRETTQTEPRKRKSDSARIQFRFFDGSSLRGEFSSSQTLREARDFLLEKAKKYVHDGAYSLSCPLPHRSLTSEMDDMTLEELDLTPSAVVIVTTSSPKKSTSSGFSMETLWQTLMLPFLLISSLFSYLVTLFTGSSQSPPSGSSGGGGGGGRGGRNAGRGSSQVWKSEREGNVYRMKTDDDDDENNTWNGNSTQQQ
eukprot:m.6327 g.6327  ORF g.6327 m.6327 type:complete len:501 (+) comp15573_c0_seq1:22-1524(+)